MLVINILYNADTRRMALSPEYSSSKMIATTGDNLSTILSFEFVDPEGTLEGYTPRVEFGINMVDEGGNSYRPYLPVIDGNVSLPNSILSSVKCGKLPMQLAFTHMDGDDKKEFYSLNTLDFGVNRAIDATFRPIEREWEFGDAIRSVIFDRGTSTFTFTQMDGTEIVISVSDALVEAHYDVEQYEELATLTEAKSGDTATILSTGVWYKLYGPYYDLDNWKMMSGGLMLNGQPTGHAMFYAPIDSGNHNQSLLSRGENQAPEWNTLSISHNLTFVNYEATVDLNGLDYDESNCKLSCSFSTNSGENVILPYKLVYGQDNKVSGISVTSRMGVPIVMTVTVIPQ